MQDFFRRILFDIVLNYLMRFDYSIWIVANEFNLTIGGINPAAQYKQ